MGDGLRSKMFLHRNGVIGASFDPAANSDTDLRDLAIAIGIRAVVRHNHTLHTLNTSHASNYTASGHIFPRIDLMSSKSRQFQERAPNISQGG